MHRLDDKEAPEFMGRRGLASTNKACRSTKLVKPRVETLPHVGDA
jgi:hypothetical protein